MNIIRETIRDKPLVELIKRFLKSGIAMEDRLVVVNDVGTLQGSPLSPPWPTYTSTDSTRRWRGRG